MSDQTLRVNGRTRRCAPAFGEALLTTLRDDFALRGAKSGCGEGECGACTVLLDGHGVNSCLLPTATIPADAEIRTVEGLDDLPETAALRSTFAAHGALQCGYCTPGVLVSLTELLRRQPAPTRDDVLAALAGHICRCTGYVQIVEATLAAAQELAAATT